LGAAEELAEPLEDFPNKNYKGVQEVREVRKERYNLLPEVQEEDNHRLEDQVADQVAAGIVAAQAVMKNTVEGPEDLEACTLAPKPDHTSNQAMSLEIQGKTMVVER
jgi:hypothetical protein